MGNSAPFFKNIMTKMNDSLMVSIMYTILLFFPFSTVHAAPVIAADTFNVNNYVPCINGLFAPGQCPPGFELPPTQGPFIAFSDLISGPDTGIGDTLGSGVVVTVWGFDLGSTQGSSTITYTDSLGVERPAANVYYWKNADGALPSGPANLFESHGMQEIAFSIPDSATGAGTIKVITGDGNTTTPFTVRAGGIFHVKSTGNDSTGDGSFADPWLTVAKADSTINAGSTLYIHDVLTGSDTSDQVIYNNRTEAMSTLAEQYGYVAYPNTRPEAIGYRVISQYAGGQDIVRGFVISKLALYAAEADEDIDGQPINVRSNVSWGIEGSRDGRAIGNYITDHHPSDGNGACPDAQQAAISANSDGTNRVENFIILGNHIQDYGCDGTTRFHHTTYMSIRSGANNDQLVAPELGYNYLQDNLAISGLHYFDENNVGVECGQFTTLYKIHDNVVINQSGAAISIGANCPVNTTFSVYNNVAINSGLAADFNGAVVGSSIFESFHFSSGHPDFVPVVNVFNNTFYKWNSQNLTGQLDSCIGFNASDSNAFMTVNWNDNICSTDADKPFMLANFLGQNILARVFGSGNSWFNTGATVTPPTFDTAPIITDPLLTFVGPVVTVNSGSPLIDASSTTLLRDVYGKVRGANSNVGAVQ